MMTSGILEMEAGKMTLENSQAWANMATDHHLENFEAKGLEVGFRIIFQISKQVILFF